MRRARIALFKDRAYAGVTRFFPRSRQLVGRKINAGDGITAAGQFNGVPAHAAAHVQNAGARLRPKLGLKEGDFLQRALGENFAIIGPGKIGEKRFVPWFHGPRQPTGLGAASRVRFCLIGFANLALRR